MYDDVTLYNTLYINSVSKTIFVFDFQYKGYLILLALKDSLNPEKFLL